MLVSRWTVMASLVILLVSKPEPGRAENSPDSTQNSLCLMLESAARSYSLPLEYFVRLIWRESRFRAEAVGPQTRNGARAQGIAQFMPGTAAERQLLDPFDPVQALPKSAEFLQQLRKRFGNLGLAAAAYNAGARRVQEWLDGTGGMPQETRSYVLAITGRPVDDWAAIKSDPAPTRSVNCREVMALLKAEPTRYVAALEQRIRSGAARPWGVQLAAGFSRGGALTSYARAVKRFGGLVAKHDPIVSSQVLRSRGTRPLYQVRIGADTRTEADSLCERIRKAGGACMVLRQLPSKDKKRSATSG
ncbi:MAG: transglycosylase SLT domain-containing protein [Rhizobiales bacterium]|nr:transglycosylase SLT domain-containing protein [Hyphomicrobiales bacterium]